jgi:hypothetical protein
MFSFGAAVEAAGIEDDLFIAGHLSERKSRLVLLARCSRRECELAHKSQTKDRPKAVGDLNLASPQIGQLPNWAMASPWSVVSYFKPHRSRASLRRHHRSSRPAGFFIPSLSERHLCAVARRLEFASLVNRRAQTVLPKPNKGGRPATGRDPVTAIRLSQEFRAAVDKWAAKQDDKPPRSP